MCLCVCIWGSIISPTLWPTCSTLGMCAGEDPGMYSSANEVIWISGSAEKCESLILYGHRLAPALNPSGILLSSKASVKPGAHTLSLTLTGHRYFMGVSALVAPVNAWKNSCWNPRSSGITTSRTGNTPVKGNTKNTSTNSVTSWNKCHDSNF